MEIRENFSDCELVLRAAATAAQAHVKQMRKTGDQPYVNHVLRVAHMASQAGLTNEAIAAALLHDVVEDTNMTLDDLKENFPPRVIVLVNLMTKWWPDDAPKTLKDRENPVYYGRILEDQEAIEIKLLDRADNLNDMVRSLPKTESWARRYLAKTEEEIEPLYKKSKNPSVMKFYSKAKEDLRRALAKL